MATASLPRPSNPLYSVLASLGFVQPKYQPTKEEVAEIAALEHFKQLVHAATDPMPQMESDVSDTTFDPAFLQPVQHCFTKLAQANPPSERSSPQSSKEFQDALAMAIEHVHTYLDQLSPSKLLQPQPSSSYNDISGAQAYFKALLLKHYLVQCAGPSPAVPLAQLPSEDVAKYIHSFLSVGPDERLKAHLQLFGAALTHPQLSKALTSLVSSVVSVWGEALTLSPVHAALPTKSVRVARKASQQHIQRVKRFSKSLLSDTFELPQKIRCIYHWAERSPELKGSPIAIKTPELVPIPVDDLLKIQRELFPQLAASTCDTCSDAYMAARRTWYNDKLQRKIFWRQAAAYFLIICVLDFCTYII